MFLNPKYGAFAFLTLPYFLLYEVLGSFFEVSSVAFVTFGWIKGILDVKTFVAFIILMILSQGLVSLLSILAFMRGQKVFRLKYISYLVFLGFAEFLWYRWIISAAKFMGTYHYLRGWKAYNQYARSKKAE